MAIQECLSLESSFAQATAYKDLHGEPTQARLCQWVEGLEPWEFDLMCSMVRLWTMCVKQLKYGPAASQAVSDTSRTRTPLVSLGPSGLGGEYQVEIEDAGE